MGDPGCDLYRRVVESAPFGVLFFTYGVCIEANPEALRLLGCTRAQLIGHGLEVAQVDESLAFASFKERVHNALAAGEGQCVWELRTVEERFRCLLHLRPGSGGQHHELVVTLHPFPMAGMIDFPPRSQSAPSLDVRSPAGGENPHAGRADSAYLDPLTQLPTRLAMLEHLRAYLAGGGLAGGGKRRCAALMLFDLDHFKDINDSWGHELGDRVLAKVAASLERHLVSGGQPGAFLARQAGDEFLLFVPGLADSLTEAAVKARTIADSMRKQLATPIFLAGAEVALTASIGIFLLGDTFLRGDAGLAAERALQYADTAMYEAKRKGRNGCAFFDRAIAAKAQRQVALNTRLRKAVDNQEFALHVQPLVSVAENRLVGGEVLLRWINCDRVTSMPAEFIPLLETSGLIVEVGHWVIRTACEILRGYLDAGIWRRDMQLHVNVSRRQFQDARLLDVIRHSLQSYAIEPDLIAFEITESLAMEDLDGAIAKMREIKALGARFAIDDFGVGHSSLSVLRRLPFDWLKIDREFVRHLHRDADARGIVEAILAVSRQYGLKVTAEGVEDGAALELLRRLGCDSYQGALYSMPIPVDRFERLLSGEAAA